MTTRFGRAGSGRPLALRLAVGVIVAGGLALTTVGCGDDGGSTKSKVASGGGSGGAKSENSGGGSGSGKGDDAARRDQMVKFASCMREHGIDMPDPEPGEGGAMRIGGMAADEASSKTEEAMKACEKFQPKSDFDPNDPKFKEWQAKHTSCLRENGVNVGDAGAGGAMVTLDASDEKVKKAMDVCNKKVPPLTTKK
ncbi:hypothetical protein [Embleya scabrispora]|uniref:hypothetical protein n=1 Tax=Embleya scabrispora TaxID=159449 RepID=UPI00069060FF|nr:hypothetical protein [Embleya scabrispora]MYS78665.1 hypothetical protein [Streptomyces sp. SID5474]